MRLAKHFEKLVRADQRYEVTHPVTMGLVCFRLKVSIVSARPFHLCLHIVLAETSQFELAQFTWFSVKRLREQPQAPELPPSIN